MTQEEIASILSRYWRPSNRAGKGPPPENNEQIEALFGCSLPPAFRMFRALLPGYEALGDHLSFEEMRAVHQSEPEINPGYTRNFLAFCAVGNGDYLCLSLSACPDSPVFYVAHDEVQVTIVAPSFEAFLNDPKWWE